MVGADLANLANEAALLAARREHAKVQMADFTDALEKILLGAPRGIMLNREDRERTAYHESGHALVGMLTLEADPVRKVSIIPRGMALGVTLSTPDADRVSYSREELEAKIKVALGGRTAEEVVYGRITTGAESDIQQLTQIARQMVGRWGMSEKLGPLTLLPSDGAGPLLPGASETSPQTQWLIDQEVQRLVEDLHAEVTELLTTHRGQLESLTQALLVAETLDAPAAYAAGGVPLPAPAAEQEPEPAGRLADAELSRALDGGRAARALRKKIPRKFRLGVHSRLVTITWSVPIVAGCRRPRRAGLREDRHAGSCARRTARRSSSTRSRWRGCCTRGRARRRDRRRRPARHDREGRRGHRELRARFGPRWPRWCGGQRGSRIPAYAARKAALRDQVAAAGPDALMVFAADKVSKVRELRTVTRSRSGA